MALPRRLERLLGYGAVALGSTALVLALLQLLLARDLERSRLRQQAAEVALTARLAALALETLPPAGVAQVSGLTLRLQPPPPAPRWPEQEALRRLLCAQLPDCPPLLPAAAPRRGVWLELVSPLEPVWLLVPLPAPIAWPPDPALLALALMGGGAATTLLYLSLEVDRPLRRLQHGLDDFGPDPQRPEGAAALVPIAGTGTVRALAARLVALQQRLQQAAAERAVMLAGLAHDLRAPLTRLRLRLSLQPPTSAADPALADLDALDRLIDQFLVFAAGAQAETPVLVPLEQLLAEVAAPYPASLSLELAPLQRWVQPVALGRAVANLLDNAFSHGAPPVLLRLQALGDAGFSVQVWDGGEGIPPADWGRALQPFQRLDRARRRGGHGGLGLPIALQVAQGCGAQLVLLRPPPPALAAAGLRSGVALQAERFGHTFAPAQLHSSQIGPSG